MRDTVTITTVHFLSEVDPYLEKGINVILEIEVEGAMKVRENAPRHS